MHDGAIDNDCTFNILKFLPLFQMGLLYFFQVVLVLTILIRQVAQKQETIFGVYKVAHL